LPFIEPAGLPDNSAIDLYAQIIASGAWPANEKVGDRLPEPTNFFRSGRCLDLHIDCGDRTTALWRSADGRGNAAIIVKFGKFR
jgi:hypothetical protein